MSQEVVGVLGVEEVEGEEGVAELGPIAVMRKGEGVSEIAKIWFSKGAPHLNSCYFGDDSFSHFHSPALVSKGGRMGQ